MYRKLSMLLKRIMAKPTSKKNWKVKPKSDKYIWIIKLKKTNLLRWYYWIIDQYVNSKYFDSFLVVFKKN